MRLILYSLVLSGALWGFGQSEMQYQGIVLKSGYLVGTQGPYEIYGEEIQFTDNSGDLKTLKLDQVDMAKTQSYNRFRQERARNTVVMDGTRYVLEEDKPKQDNPRTRSPGDLEITNDSLGGSGGSQSGKQKGVSLSDLQNLSEDEAAKMVEEAITKFEKEMAGPPGILLLGLLGLTAFLLMTNNLMSWYALFKAFMEDGVMAGMLVFAVMFVLPMAYVFGVGLVIRILGEVAGGVAAIGGGLLLPAVKDIVCFRVFQRNGDPGCMAICLFWGWWAAVAITFTALFLLGFLAILAG